MNTELFKIKIGNILYKYCFPIYNIAYTLYKNKSDAKEINLLASIIKPGFQILDIGGNIGFYTKVLSKLTGMVGHVHTFEPDVLNFKYLKNNTANYKNVTLVNAAISNKKSVINIYKSKLLNVDHRTYPINNYDTIDQINAITIDEYLIEHNISKIDLIKIDIQGYEMEAFAGMQQLLKSNDEIKIVAEFWPHGLRKAGKSTVAFFNFFTELNFNIYLLEDNSRVDLAYVKSISDKDFSFYTNILIQKN